MMFLFMSVLVIASIGLLNIQVPNWERTYLPIFSFFEGKFTTNHHYSFKNVSSALFVFSTIYSQWIFTNSENIQHTKSRHSRIAVIREGDLPFANRDAGEKIDIDSTSYGNFIDF